MVGFGSFKDTGVNLNRREMAGRWLGDGWEMAAWLPLAISKDCGGDYRSLQDGWEISDGVVDRQEMAGRWLGGLP